jgi:adenylate cyclase
MSANRYRQRRRMRLRADIRRVLWVAIGGAIGGALYGSATRGSVVTGATIGVASASWLSGLEIFVLRPRAAALLRRVPFVVYLALRIGLYLLFIVVILAVGVPLMDGSAAIGDLSRRDIAFGFGMSVAFNLIVGVNDLLGPGVLFAFVAGRYYEPRREERALICVDLRSSTAIAERLGEISFLELLNGFFSDVSIAIAEEGGEIHKYVGDEIIAAWRLKPGRNEPGVVRACFGAGDRLVARAELYRREFGVEPAFRAALHAGPVVLGELGYLKKEIALIGDAMNTAARILEACRETAHPILASGALLERLTGLPDGIAACPMAPLAARGKSAPLDVFALKRVDKPASGRSAGGD